MKTRSILVRYPGYPFAFEALAPDVGIASAAGALLDAGHMTRIEDYGTVDHLGYVYPAEVRDMATRLIERMLSCKNLHPLEVLQTLWELRKTDRAFLLRQSRFSEEAAISLGAMKGLDFVAFKIDQPDDVRGMAEIARRLRLFRPDLCMAGWGRLVELHGGALLEAVPALDCLWVGDIELVAPAFAERAREPEHWDELPNVVYRRNGRVRHTRRVWLDHLGECRARYEPEVYPALWGGGKLRLFTVEDSRGCGCSGYGCPHPYEDAGLRMKSAREVCEEMARLVTSHGAVVFQVDGPGTPAMHAGAVAQAVLTRGLGIMYGRGGRLTDADPGAFATLRASGCGVAAFDVDSGSQRLLTEHFGHGAGVSQIEGVLRECRQSGIFTVARLRYPTPADDHHTRDETLRIVMRTRPDAAPVHMPLAWPHSEWRRRPTHFGYGEWPRDEAVALPAGRARFPMPRGRWQAPPVAGNRQTPGQAMDAHEDLLCELEGQGVPAWLPELTAVVARCLGEADSVREFRDRTERAFLTGDTEAVAETVRDFNDRAVVPAEAARWAQDGLRKAVGD